MPIRIAISQAALQQEQLFMELETLFTLALRALDTASRAGWLDQQDMNYLIDSLSHAPHPDAFQALCLDVIAEMKGVMPTV